VSDSDDEVAKYLIVLTDGKNTQNRFSSNTNSVDARTKLACSSARAAGTVFTIRMIEGDKTLLEECASKDEKGQPRFHDVLSADELPQVFRSIANEIANLRIAS
jgi:Mg-chelatase subunit ChlD